MSAGLTACALVCCGLEAVGSSSVSPDAATDGADEGGIGIGIEAGPLRDADVPFDAFVIDANADGGAEQPSIISPYHPSGTLTFQRAIDWTIASADAAAVIRYTSDGTIPSASSPSAVGKVTLAAVPDNTTLRWLTAPGTTVHSFLVRVDSSLSSSTQGFVDRVAFDATGAPVATVSPGATVTGTGRTFLWNSGSSCPNCIDQLLVGVTLSEACFTDRNPQVYPGVTALNVPFSVKAPSAPGVYTLQTGFTQQFKCTPDAIGRTLGQTRIATIIVK